MLDPAKLIRDHSNAMMGIQPFFWCSITQSRDLGIQPLQKLLSGAKQRYTLMIELRQFQKPIRLQAAKHPAGLEMPLQSFGRNISQPGDLLLAKLIGCHEIQYKVSGEATT